jgi:GNAT superfamily N-acetyltransferase
VSGLRIEPLGERNAQAWAALFDRSHLPCFCRYWHFDGTKNDWLARCAMDPKTSRDEALAALGVGASEALGLVAVDESGRAIGWMKLTPRASVPKLRKLPLYRGLDLGGDDGVWSIGCFLVDPDHRRRGVAAALLDAAPAFVRARGGAAIEAYPRHLHEADRPRLHDEEAWMGPESLFMARGFARVAEERATQMYPVYRLVLTGATPPTQAPST